MEAHNGRKEDSRENRNEPEEYFQINRNGPREMSMQMMLLQLFHQFHRSCIRQMGEIEVHPGQFPVLKMLADHPGASQKELAKLLHIKPPTVNVTVKRLENAKLVYRQKSREDQRVYEIYLTEKGREGVERMRIIMKENEERMLSGFSESEICLMKRFLKQMTDNLDGS